MTTFQCEAVMLTKNHSDLAVYGVTPKHAAGVAFQLSPLTYPEDLIRSNFMNIWKDEIFSEWKKLHDGLARG